MATGLSSGTPEERDIETHRKAGGQILRRKYEIQVDAEVADKKWVVLVEKQFAMQTLMVCENIWWNRRLDSCSHA